MNTAYEKRLTIRQVMERLNLDSYRRAYDLVNSGALGELQGGPNGRGVTVSEAAVLEVRAVADERGLVFIRKPGSGDVI